MGIHPASAPRMAVARPRSARWGPVIPARLIGMMPERLTRPTVGFDAHHTIGLRWADDRSIRFGPYGSGAEVGGQAFGNPELDPHGFLIERIGLCV